ncbi:serine--tRNA ligase [Candidatus Microgenomates bacterium]|nr:serine--tRNA ligase [Candidatus Microgenomates bacterium]
MLDIRFVTSHPEKVKDDLKKRNKADRIWMVDELMEDYKGWKTIKNEIDTLRHQRNALSEQINKLKKEKKDAPKLLAEVKDIPNKIKVKEEEGALLEKDINDKLVQIPNLLHSSVPIGKDAEDNKEVRKWGKPVKPKFELLNHAELIEKLGCADFDTGRSNAGQGFNYLLGAMAQVDLALQRYGIDFLLKKKFTPVIPPLLLNFKTLLGAVNGLQDFQDVVYKIENEDLYLVGTAEHPLVALMKNKTLSSKELPLRLCAVTPCFRKEIGAHGVDTKGLFRMHQFNKVEQVVYCHPDHSFKMLEEMQKITEEFVQSLEIPYRVIEICSGDLGAKLAKQYDIEAWFPRQNTYAEITSAGNCTDYQARSLNIRYQQGQDKNHVHILNNTMVATSRNMVALLENFQQKDGSVNIPTVLQKYTGFKKIA